MCVCVRGKKTDSHWVKVDDGCLLLLTAWWIATGLCKCLVQRMSGVRKAVSSFTVTQSKQMCVHISIQMLQCQFYLSQDVIIIYLNFELRNPWEVDTSKNIPAEHSLGWVWHFYRKFMKCDVKCGMCFFLSEYLSWLRIGVITKLIVWSLGSCPCNVHHA